jgi:hypothetical protein
MTVAPKLRKEVLERQNLPPVPQRALRQQPDLGQAVEHDAIGPRAFDGVENLPRDLAQFEVG